MFLLYKSHSFIETTTGKSLWFHVCHYHYNQMQMLEKLHTQNEYICGRKDWDDRSSDVLEAVLDHM